MRGGLPTPTQEPTIAQGEAQRYDCLRQVRGRVTTTSSATLRIAQSALAAVQAELDREKTNRTERLKHRASQRIDFLEKFIIPILLGALGSVIYTLRSMVGAIRQSTYTKHFASMSLVRISLGTIAGLLGVMVFPSEMLPGKEVFPLALPLLLGYAVEIFFTVMDRLVKAFTDPTK